MEIKVLGSGCAKCKTLEKVTREAVEKAGVEANVEKIEDIMKVSGIGQGKFNQIKEYISIY